MRPFFMSIISDSDHWLFIGSNGGLTAGRKDADNALFPYYTDDKIIESADVTGPKTIFRIQGDGDTFLWEPFSVRYANLYDIERNLYKNTYGNKVLFEEVNHDLKLTFRYQWSTSSRFGFVRTSWLVNDGGSAARVALVDGIQNIMPYGVGSALQNKTSNLVDAYKRSELETQTGVGIFALSAIIVDKPEPSEALKASIAWSLGLSNATHLLSSRQLENFRKGIPLQEETDVKAEKGAYFLSTDVSLPAGESKEWMIVADVSQTATQILSIAKTLREENELALTVKQDIAEGTRKLIQLNAAADGLQFTADGLRDTRHFANVMFNIMRGGIFDNNYQIDRKDFQSYLAKANKQVAEWHARALESRSAQMSRHELIEFCRQSDDNDFKRLCLEYLPLKFSRRHGDPSRPWNRFSINTQGEDGAKILDYAGNWRDIFQNWEALAHSYPEFIDGMILKFLNATTFDGYNPYRITKNGIDWERIEADDPWSYIGYWGDHQIIYLLKFLEFSEMHRPGKLASYLNENLFVYANVPYKIKSYEQILRTPKETIDFDHQLDRAIDKRWQILGADSALLQDKTEAIHHVNFVEKILALVMAKMSNFIPEGGIWMNTQRPEWNDANNALVGHGVSMVTLCYLRRFFTFLIQVMDATPDGEVMVSEEVVTLFQRMNDTLRKYQPLLAGSLSDKNRREILDALGSAASHYRQQIYAQSFSGNKRVLPIANVKSFSSLCLAWLDHTIHANKRQDNLYHAYNLMTVEGDGQISISHLDEMLEGQVAVLSSGCLTAGESLETLDSLKASRLFRRDQYSYLLYPNKDLPGFLKKNVIQASDIDKSSLLKALVKAKDRTILEQDSQGNFHFNGNFRNAADLKRALDKLDGQLYSVTDSSKDEVLQIFERVFNHKAFTGRSGTFFGYEGLGSIYWHMVSKLQLAAQECCLKAVDENESADVVGRLLAHYYEINEGIGVHKSPTLYGAFPTDPYSHTPATKGAQQPGMTGQVKEDILSRFGELGVRVKEGRLFFQPTMLKKSEFLTEAKTVTYVNVNSEEVGLALQPQSLLFTYCQVPVVYQMSNQSSVSVQLRNGSTAKFERPELDLRTSAEIFGRTGTVLQLIVYIDKKILQ
ncbi:MAG: hypothetical protein JNL17_00445 [Cyclobacteriaceae bacterium]|nr:hypothetical protein [Cyclobacteriaceae bacterium]